MTSTPSALPPFVGGPRACAASHKHLLKLVKLLVWRSCPPPLACPVSPMLGRLCPCRVPHQSPVARSVPAAPYKLGRVADGLRVWLPFTWSGGSRTLLLPTALR